MTQLGPPTPRSASLLVRISTLRGCSIERMFEVSESSDTVRQKGEPVPGRDGLPAWPHGTAGCATDRAAPYFKAVELRSGCGNVKSCGGVGR